MFWPIAAWRVTPCPRRSGRPRRFAIGDIDKLDERVQSDIVRKRNHVHHPLRDTRSRAFLALTLVPAFCAVPLASAEIFKCVEKNGPERYQNFPCHIESLGSLPSSPPSAKTTLPPSDAGQAKPKAAPVDVASSAQSANAREPRKGMTPDEVRAIWGEPVETIQDEPIDGRIEIWRYGDSRAVHFNHNHRVVAVLR